MSLFKSADQIKDEAKKKIEPLLLKDEIIEHESFNGLDFIMVTNFRLLMIDKRIGSTETAVITLPYNRITAVSINMNFLKFPKIKIVASGFDVEITAFTPDSARLLHQTISYKMIFGKIN